MEAIKSDIEGLVILEPRIFGDSRGYFFESWTQRDMDRLLGRHVDFVQENQSRSQRGVVRGLHFQRPPYAQAKLVRVVEGRVLDVVVDLRRDSSTYGRVNTIELSADNCRQVFVPRGLAHGFAVLSDYATFIYKCDDYYHPETEGGIVWDDPQLAIDWQVSPDEIILSEKDSRHPSLADFDSPF